MEVDDPFPRPVTFRHLFAEEKPGEAADLGPATAEEERELARPVRMPPLTEREEENPPAIRLKAPPDPALDDPAITEQMKRADDVVSRKFIHDHKDRLLRPWDEVDLS